MIGPLPEDHLRLVVANINGFPVNHNDPQHGEFFTAMNKYEVSTIFLQEPKTNWKNVPYKSKWHFKLKQHLDMSKTKSVKAHNTHDITRSILQQGGTAIISTGDFTQHAMGANSDPTGLGRWCWALYRGHQGMKTRFVSIYRPCKSQGANSVYKQHIQYFQSKNRDICPRQAFMDDLDIELTKWIAQGDQILIGGDLNQNIFSDQIQQLFSKHGLHNLIFPRHDRNTAPPSHQNCDSQRTIDGIWGTANIKPFKCGYLDYNDFTGDHHPIWCDIPSELLFGRRTTKLCPPQIRRLKLIDTTAVERYLKNLKAALIKHNIFERQYKLEDASKAQDFTMTKTQEKEANDIDDIKAAAMLHAELKCRKLCMGAIAFSEATEGPKRKIQFWKLAIKRRRGARVRSRHWKRKKKKAKITEQVSILTLNDMEQRLTAAYTEYNKAKPNAEDSRISFIKTFPEKVQQRILRTEEQRRQATVSRYIRDKLQGGSITKVIVTNDQGIQEELTSKHRVEQAYMATNESKYRQTEKSAFMHGDLHGHFGYLGNTTATEEVLDGTFTCPPGTHPIVQQFIHCMQTPVPLLLIPPCTNIVTTEDHINAWKKMKEKTSSGISGLHFGMFKAHLLDHDLAALDASMRSLAYSTGFVYDRWKNGLDVALLKRKKDFRVEKLRTILLLEADANMNYKKLSRDVMHHAEDAKVINPENYGGRKNHRAVEVALNQRLTGDILRHLRKSAIICSHDAKGCFDRIVHAVAYVCLRRLGMPSNPIKSMLKAIQEMEHYVRTAFGDSEDSYGPSPDRPPMQGLLQGNGASGTGWMAISIVIVEMMREAGFGFKTWSSISHRAIELVCYQFVDDTTLVHSSDNNETSGEELLNRMQDVLDHWEIALKATGGALAPEKSFWYMIDFKWKAGAWHYRTEQEVPGDLYLPDTDDNGDPCQRKIDRLEVDQAREVLGIQIRYDGKELDEVKYLRSKTDEWKDAIRTKRILVKDAWYCLKSTIMKTIEYPLLSTTMNHEQCAHIMAPILLAGLPKSGVQSRFPRKLVHGSLRSQGMDVDSLWVSQLIVHLHGILRHSSKRSLTGDLLDTLMECLQLETGSKLPFWELDPSIYEPWTTESWMKDVWKGLHTTTLRLKGPLSTTPIQRQHDSHIIDDLIRRGFRGDRLNRLSNYRMYLEVNTVADITTANGIKIEPLIWQGLRLPRSTPYNWPRSHKPPRNDLILWQHALQDLYLAPHATSRRLQHALGRWKTSFDKHWHWWYDPLSDNLYHFAEDTWTEWTRTESRTNTRRYDPSDINPPGPPPNPVYRASTFQRLNCTSTFMTSYGRHEDTHQPPQPLDLDKSINDLPNDLKWTLKHFHCDDSGALIAQALRLGHAIAVCDASLKDIFGTAALVIEGMNHLHRFLGINIVPGPLKNGDSYRCELTGILGIMIAIACIVKLHNVQQGSITLACDCDSTLKLFQPGYHPTPQQPNYDLVSAICQNIRDSPITWHTQPVTGHQDDHYGPLTRLETLNVEMDNTAKMYWNQLLLSGHSMIPPHLPFHHEGWSIWNGNNKIASPNRKTLYSAIQDPITLNWWTRHDRFPPQAITSIDWDACEANMKALGLSRRRYVTKHASEECGVGITLLRWKKQTDNECPRCDAPEDSKHVIICSGRGADTKWDSGTESLDQKLEFLDTYPPLAEALLTRLQQWRSNQPLRMDPLWSRSIVAVIADQDVIGWKNMLEGLASSKWAKLQQRHYSAIQSDRTGKRWITSVLQQLHSLAHGQWEHRNDVLHRTLRPRERLAVDLLHEALRAELTRGPEDLPLSDRRQFRISPAALCNKPLAYKQSWLLNVHAARQRLRRRTTNNPTLIICYPEREPLLFWIEHGRLP